MIWLSSQRATRSIWPTYEKTFECTKKHGLKMNPNKCSFDVSTGQFLGLLIRERGIKVGQKSIIAIDRIEAPSNKKELQLLIGKINFIRRFISNLLERIQSFASLLNLKADQKLIWGEKQQKALE
jgi:hypothetical protein